MVERARLTWACDAANEISTTHRRSICFYEHDAGFPMQRHTNGQYAAARKNTVFTVKSVSTVGNCSSPLLESLASPATTLTTLR